MAFTIAVIRERRAGETRVAATPDTVKKFKEMGAEVLVEAGAGVAASFPDSLYVEAGAKVVAINPTCAMMMRREYPELLPEALRPEARKLAELVRDPSELLWEIRDQPRFNTDFKSTPGGPVAYHAPCHLRAQAVGFKGRDLLRKIPGVQPKLTMECCGHDGTYAMKVEGFENSIKVGQKAFDGMKDAKAEVWATDCPLAALQFQQHAGKKPMHPMSILARAYRADGFSTPVEKGAEKKDGEK